MLRTFSVCMDQLTFLGNSPAIMRPKITNLEFVVLRETDYTNASVPRRQRLQILTNLNRVHKIQFCTTDSSEAVLALLTATFPCLRHEEQLIARSRVCGI